MGITMKEERFDQWKNLYCLKLGGTCYCSKLLSHMTLIWPRMGKLKLDSTKLYRVSCTGCPNLKFCSAQAKLENHKRKVQKVGA